MTPYTLQNLVVSENRRFLTHADGTPFFYLADTAWELFHRLTREEADVYLSCRAAQNFTVIHAVVLAEFEGLTVPNPYGQVPFEELDPTRPNETYFEHVDWIVDRAAARGLRVALLPSWGDKVAPKMSGVGPEVFTPENAAVYAGFLARRYKGKSVLWIIGGDRGVVYEEQRAVWQAMAESIKRVSPEQLMSFHPPGGNSSGTYFPDADWLDYLMVQTGHVGLVPNYEAIERDYARRPVKPCMDGEPCYEDSPVMTPEWTATDAWFGDHAVRRAAYWSLFAGSHGHTYGCHDVWQFWDPSRERINEARTPWQEAIKLPGAEQMRHARVLLESRPFLTRIPDQDLIASDSGKGAEHVQATRASDGAYAFVYTPTGKSFTVDLSLISGPQARAWWFDPCSGAAREIGLVATAGKREFTPPQDAGPDWVFVLDDAARGFPPPGQ